MKLNKKYIVVVIISIILVWVISIYLNLYRRNKIILKAPVFLHTVITKQYPEVRFAMDESGLQTIKNLQSSGIKCQKEYRYPFGNYIVCYNATGFEHIYSVPFLHLNIIPYKNMYPYYTSWLFSTGDIIKPFILSGNGIYQIDENNHTTSIQYFNFKSWETPATILSGQWIKNVSMIGSSWSRSEYTFSDSAITQDEWSVYMYYFDSSKSYYYLVRAASYCVSSECGIDQHRIWFFVE